MSGGFAGPRWTFRDHLPELAMVLSAVALVLAIVAALR